MQDCGDSLPTTSAVGQALTAGGRRLALQARKQETASPEQQLIGPDTSTWKIGLSYCSQHRLSRAGFKTLADLEGVTDEALLAIDGVGPKSVEVIRAALIGLDRLALTDLTVHEGTVIPSFDEHPTEIARQALVAAATVETEEWAAILRRVASALPLRDEEGGE
jgi:Bacterial RNA polymerase, alpha chain C terminal domain